MSCGTQFRPGERALLASEEPGFCRSMRKIRTLSEVVDWRLCLGCGACASVCPDERVTLWDYLEEGIRPEVSAGDCGSCRACLDVCPSVRSDFSVTSGAGNQVVTAGFAQKWGPVHGLWEGHATDPEIREKGSSGGALTALGAYAVEVLGWSGVLHIAQDAEDPLRNRTVLSCTRAELVAATGSRYSPASVANGLREVEAAANSCVIIGKPSEIAAVENARRLRSGLDAKVGLTMSFFCAETPSTHGTEALLRRMKVEPQDVASLRYRGFGWPGFFAPTLAGQTEPYATMTYRESWAFLQAHRPWSVQLWPDGSGELADISCGDPWYEEPDGKNPGFSLVVARTARGKAFVDGAVAAGYLTLVPAEAWKLERSQQGLLAKKGAVWGRRLALRWLGLPLTELAGLDLRPSWKTLTFSEKLKATLGTVRRVMTRGLRRPLVLDKSTRTAVKPVLAVPPAAP